MKKLFLTLSLAITCIFSQGTFAASVTCDSEGTPGYIHCVTAHGFPRYPHGRWIKINQSSNEASLLLTACMSGNGVDFVEISDSAPDGQYTTTFSICTDSSGSDCKQFGQDNFSVTSSASGKQADPEYYNLYMTDALKEMSPDCNPIPHSVVREKLLGLLHH